MWTGFASEGKILRTSSCAKRREWPVGLCVSVCCRARVLRNPHSVGVHVKVIFFSNRFLSLQQQQADGYGGPPPSPVVAGSWGDRAGYVDDGYMRQDPNILPAAGTPLASTASGNGEAAGFMVSTGG